MKRTPIKRGRGFAASPEQRAKVKAMAYCLNCAREQVDPAHVIDRSLGGCDRSECVIPLCRFCHDLYDTGNLDVLPILETRFRDELAHAVGHVGLLRALERITNEHWTPERNAA